jgi:hypothetical protein
MLQIYLKCNNFAIDLHCHTCLHCQIWGEKGGLSGVPPLENVYIFEALALHFWRFLKQICKQIGCKWTVFYKNGYDFTKIITLLRKILPENVKILT